MNYIAELAYARGVAEVARQEAKKARIHTQPLAPELAKILQEHKPMEYAECMRRVAAIKETIPALDAAVEAAEAALAPIEKRACWKCGGTGRYAGATNATRRGVPYCFRCDGHGTIR
jgi:hypothetical protein